MIRRFRAVTTRLQDRISRLTGDQPNDQGASSVEYVLLTVLGIVIAGLIAVAVTAFVNGQIALF
jgi:Flp pilus assembly pilin Flp